MIWDSPLTRAVAKELEALLGGARVRGHRFNWEDRELALYLRSSTLRWSLHPQKGWMDFHPPQDPPEDARPLSAHVVGVEAGADERVLRIHLHKLRGRIRRVQIVVELMTGQWNALFLEGEEEWIRHLLWTRRSESRTLSVGLRYHPPEPSTRKGARAPLSQPEWSSLVDSLRAEGEEKALLGELAFSSPINLSSLTDQAGDEGADPTPLQGGFPLWERLRTLETIQPCVLETTGGKQPYPIVLHKFSFTHFPTVLEALGSLPGDTGQIGPLHERVMKGVERALHQARGRVLGVQREIDRGADPDEVRGAANLLLARLGEIPRGATEAQLIDFEGEPVSIPLDPSITPQENADDLYKEASRLERARERLPLLLAEVRKKVEGLERLGADLTQGRISPEEAEARLPGGPKPTEKPGRPEAHRLPYLRYRSSGGLEIRVGRGSTDNDALTFRHSRPEDIWLHARDVSGAHVILRWTEPEPPPAKDLAEAAILAAVHSRARTSGVTPVDWTRRKHVRKPRKSRPGTVTPKQTQTIFVEPDTDLPKRLRLDD